MTQRERELGLVALYDFVPGKGAGLFLRLRSPHGALLVEQFEYAHGNQKCFCRCSTPSASGRRRPCIKAPAFRPCTTALRVGGGLDPQYGHLRNYFGRFKYTVVRSNLENLSAMPRLLEMEAWLTS